MSNENEWSAPDPRGGHGGGAEQPGADQPGRGQAQDGWGQPMPPPPPTWGGQQPQVAKPGVIPLRPLGLGEILDGAISTIRAYPKLTLGVSAVVVGIGQVITVAADWVILHNINIDPAAFDQTNPSGPEILSFVVAGLAGVLVTAVISLLTSLFLSGFLTVVVGRAVLGQPVSFGEVWAQIRRRLFPLLGLTILYSVIVGAAGLVFIIPGIWLSGLFSLATIALVLERASVGRALSRSRELVRGSWWRVFLILLLCTIIATIIGAIISIPFSLLDGGLNGGAGGHLVPPLGSMVLSAIGATVAGTITYPFISMSQALLYVDQRMRREGMDIELARMAGVPGAPGYPGGHP